MTGGGDPSHRFFNRGGEPADEVLGEGRASVAARRGFRNVGVDGDAAARMENEFWVATLAEATGVAKDDAFCVFLAFSNTKIKGL